MPYFIWRAKRQPIHHDLAGSLTPPSPDGCVMTGQCEPPVITSADLVDFPQSHRLDRIIDALTHRQSLAQLGRPR